MKKLRLSMIFAFIFTLIGGLTPNAFAQTQGTMITLDSTTGKLLLSEGAGSGTYAAFRKHNQAPIQMVMTNCANGDVKTFNKLWAFTSSKYLIKGADGKYVTCEEITSRAATLFDNPEQVSSSTNHYRIPAITLTKDKNILAISDLRIGGSGDIGSNAISIVAKKSADNGATWGTESTIIAGNGSGFDYAHGDAAVVTDIETGKIILLAASGTTGYGSGGVQLGQYYSTDNGATWTGSEITSAIKTAFTNANISVSKQFFTSGRIIQSKKVKVGSNFRIYSALCTDIGSVVMYSDNFGTSWAVLGGKVAYSGGDETVLEELPNGDLLLSARLSGMGRGFAVYNYSDLSVGTGSWNSTTATGISSATNCNGEMLLVPTTNANVYVLLHSVALSGRNNVTIYYKLFNTTASEYTSPSFYSSGWEEFKQVSTTSSAYSTMGLDANGDVAFLYEENNYSVNGAASYDIVFKSYRVVVQELKLK